LTGGNPSTGSGALLDGFNAGETYFPWCTPYNSGQNMGANFGQKPFAYAPPEGFQPLSFGALSRSEIANPSQYVGVATYNGASTTNAITGIGFKPDAVWFKNRTNANSHALFDSVRGKTSLLYPNTTDQADTVSDFDSFDYDGVTLSGSNNSYNNSSYTYVGWCWKAGGNKNTFNIDDVGYASAAAAGLDGGSLDPAGASVNTKSKFGIYTWAGHGSSNETLAHGLGAKPDFMVCKKYSTGGNNWVIWHKSIGVTKYLMFTDAGDATDTTLFNSHTNDSDTLWSLGTNNSISDTGQSAVAYLWCDVPGMQKFGSYEGNNVADGTFVELGFRPAIVIFKNIDASEDWMIVDDNRSRYNPVQPTLYPNAADIESSATNRCDFLSNGFKLRSGTSIPNTANTYIYAAWAEQPMNNFFGGQSNAR